MSDPYLGEMRIFSFNFAPEGWAQCNGQLLAINQYQALFAILGTTYGGNGTSNFALPNLQGRLPLHQGNNIVLGQSGGEAAHTLIVSEIPEHFHIPNASDAPPSAGSLAGNVWAAGNGAFAATANTSMSPAGLANTGGSQPHENRSPFLTLNVCIALAGIFPSQN
jgi:microcystin-dependent protein